MSKTTRPTIQKSDDLAAIDAELNVAMEQLDLTNTKVSEILGEVSGTPQSGQEQDVAKVAGVDVIGPRTPAGTVRPGDRHPEA